MKHATYKIENEGKEPITVTIKGRLLWALECLERGPVTPIGRPAPRWSGYIHELRGAGVNIWTETLKHGGEFKGTHGKYHLVSKVSKVEGSSEVAA